VRKVAAVKVMEVGSRWHRHSCLCGFSLLEVMRRNSSGTVGIGELLSGWVVLAAHSQEWLCTKPGRIPHALEFKLGGRAGAEEFEQA